MCKNICYKKYSCKSSYTSSKFLDKLKKYKDNEKQISCIKKVLIEHSDVPIKLLEWLITASSENAIISYKLKNRLYI